ncbi:MAG TPA: hypothetical protein VF619_12335 [Allosphingosinicella sp.]|jgi:hypothetical protein
MEALSVRWPLRSGITARRDVPAFTEALIALAEKAEAPLERV